jgi:hypothetical protein
MPRIIKTPVKARNSYLKVLQLSKPLEIKVLDVHIPEGIVLPRASNEDGRGLEAALTSPTEMHAAHNQNASKS